MKKRAITRTYVNHPRFGDKPRSSGNKSYSLEEVLSAYWGYKADAVFLETAIPANIEKQNFSLYPRKLYVDVEKQCIECHRWFIFFAEEQKYWYETLGIYIYANCVKCVPCRKKEQSINQMMQEYERLKNTENRTEVETSKLKNIALELFQLGYIRDKNKIDSIK